jgi:multidrug efflux pump subunit AcrA (membrane-fusion protein)
MKIVGWMIGIVLTALLIGGAGYMGYQQTNTPVSDIPVIPITVAVSQGDVQKTVTAPGQLVGTQEQLLSTAVDGRLTELNVRPGTVVQAGDLLARLDPTPYRTALESAQIQLALAEAAYRQQLSEAELAIQGSQAQVGSVQAQIPSLTAAEIN